MKNLLQHLLTYSLILFAITLAVPSFAQGGGDPNGPPSIRKEASDGREGCHLVQNKDHNLTITVSFTDSDYNKFCDMYIGYRHIGQPYVYVPVVLLFDEDGYSATIIIPFTAMDIAYRCETGIFGFRIGLYCLEDGQYVSILNDNLPDDSPLDICCEDEEPLDGEGLPDPEGDDAPGTPIKANSDIDIFEFDKSKNLGAKGNNSSINSGFVDYFLYDLHGNPIKTLENISLDNSIQDLVSKLSIKTGIYFVRYLDNGKIQTNKVIKF